MGCRGAWWWACGWLALLLWASAARAESAPDAGAARVVVPVAPSLPVITAPGQEIVLTGGRKPIRAFVERGRLSSQKLILVRSQERLRGWLMGAKIELRMESPTEITGRVGDRPIRLTMQRTPERLQIIGQFAGHPVDMIIDRRAIEGVMAGCEWTMRADGDSYLGNMICEGTPYTGRLRIPASLASAPAPEFMGMLVALLSV